MTNNLAREPFTTIDDAIRLAQELLARLSSLSEYKHPLAVRKARSVTIGKEVDSMSDEKASRQIKAGSRTYFLDVETTGEGKKYLRITESRFKGEGSDRERASIIVFPENAREFSAAISEMIDKL
jgi:Protein of unknown function (DUF3276)